MTRRRTAWGWFPLSGEARALLASGWGELVELTDGPVAQGLITGAPRRAFVLPAGNDDTAPDEPDNQMALDL